MNRRTLGYRGPSLNEKRAKAENEYRAENGDSRIHSMALPDQDTETYGYGSDFHPNEKSQHKLAEMVQAFIQNT